MKKDRCRFSLTAFGKSLLAFGGVSEGPGEEEEGDEGLGTADESGGERLLLILKTNNLIIFIIC